MRMRDKMLARGRTKSKMNIRKIAKKSRSNRPEVVENKEAQGATNRPQ